MAFTGVFPVYKMVFKIGTNGTASTAQQMMEVADLESLSLSIDGNTEEWTPMTTDGWAKTLMTGKKFSMDLSAKRNVGDDANDYIASRAWKDGLDCNTKAEIVFPDGATLAFECVLDVSNPGSGASTDVAALEFTVHSNGKPKYTEAA